jgi:hypothetical protein
MATIAVAPSIVGSVQAQSARFVESGAGTYTTLIDIIVEAEALWAAGTSAVMDIGDSADADGYFSAVNLKATDLLAGESMSIGSTQTRGGDDGAYLTVGTSTHISRRFSSASRTISAVVTSVGAGATGRTRVTVVYSVGAPTNITL